MKDKWTDQQKRIYDGLASIGQEIAGFYEAGLKIRYDNNFPNGAYLLLHTAREIDGGLRDILAVDYEDKGDPCPNCGKPQPVKDNHKNNILFSLGTQEYQGLAKDWFDISKKFHGYAHRSGAWKEPRKLGDVLPVWNKFESVLDRLVGSYLAFIARVERMGKIMNIEEGVVASLINILSVPTYYRHFFRNEKSPNWFVPLKEKGYFSPEQIRFDERGNAFFWEVFDYLERVSEFTEKDSGHGKDLLEIIDVLVQFSQDKKRINNYHIWWTCLKILKNISDDIIKANLSVEKFQSWLSVWIEHSGGSDLVTGDIGKDLLPKFLAASYDRAYFETIIEVLTQIKGAGDAYGFTEREGVVLAWDSYWIRESFDKHSQDIGKACSSGMVLLLANRLKESLEYKQKNYYANITLGRDVYQVWVSRALSTGARIKFKDNVYQCSIRKFSDDQIKTVNSQDGSMKLYGIKPEIDLKQFDFIAINREGFVSAIQGNLIEGPDWGTVDKLKENLESIFDGLWSDYSQIWFKSIAAGERDHASGAEEILTGILRDILLVKLETNKDEGRQILGALLSGRYPFPIFQRLVLFCVDKLWGDYSEFFIQFFDEKPTCLQEPDFEVEIHDVFKNHGEDFNGTVKTRIKAAIDDVPEYYIKEGPKLMAYWKYKWLSPLRGITEFSAVYEEAKRIAMPEGDKPFEPQRTAFRGGFVTHKSKISKERILQMPVPELMKELNDFKDPDFWQSRFEEAPDKEGLSRELQAAVKEDPQRFCETLDEFHKAPQYYVNCLLEGFRDAWQSGKDIEWNKIFDFCLQYLGIDKDAFLAEVSESQGDDARDGKYIWIVNTVVDLIAEGCRDDARAFDPMHFEKVDKIFNLILSFLKREQPGNADGDVVSRALNTTMGRTIYARFLFALRTARVMKGPEKDWGQSKFEPLWGIEACVWFGRFLPQLIYLDGDYSKNKINLFAQKSGMDPEWQAFMSGYLWEGVHSNVYPLMRENYLKALDINLSEKSREDQLVEHISCGYLYCGESLVGNNSNDQISLFGKMLLEAAKLNKMERWIGVVDYFWAQTKQTIRKEDQDKEAKETTEDAKQRILAFWKWTYEQKDSIGAMLGDKYPPFLDKLATMTILLDKIDDDAEKWLLLSAPHINQNRNASFFIEYLTKFEDPESIKRIGRIFRKILEHSNPTFRQEEIELIVRRIYDKGDRRDANAICNAYGSKGIYDSKGILFLRPLWEEYQNKQVEGFLTEVS